MVGPKRSSWKCESTFSLTLLKDIVLKHQDYEKEDIADQHYRHHLLVSLSFTSLSFKKENY